MINSCFFPPIDYALDGLQSHSSNGRVKLQGWRKLVSNDVHTRIYEERDRFLVLCGIAHSGQKCANSHIGAHLCTGWSLVMDFGYSVRREESNETLTFRRLNDCALVWPLGLAKIITKPDKFRAGVSFTYSPNK